MTAVKQDAAHEKFRNNKNNTKSLIELVEMIR